MQAAKKIEQNKFGLWGINDWREIKPKTINDKIYLILKNSGKPMHFAEIADRINQISFDKKKANAATVHNELILDEKYILVGRGLYGLKEWGYQKGTVADVIEKIIAESGQPLNREEIINKVLEQRIVKKATINLALMNRDKFEVTGDGKYKIKNNKPVSE
ncbi:MAG: HTH domain-containing protein [Patescibacteria group bacterium]